MNAALPSPALAGLVQLEQQARAAESLAMLGFVMVNDSHLLLPYRQALLWDAQAGRLLSLSGLACVEHDAPFVHWISQQCRQWQTRCAGPALTVLHADSVAREDQAQWADYLPPHLVWLPLVARNGQLLGALLLAREQPLGPAETALLPLLQDAYAHAWHSLRPATRQRSLGWRRDKRWWLGGGVVLLGILALPIRQAALAPAEIVALQPSVLRAPLQGVVERILVEPNQPVSAGQALIQLDARELQSRLQSSRQALAIADGEFRQAQQQALSDERSKAGLAVLQGRREQAMSEVNFLQQNLERTRILAPHAGVALFDDPSDWIGRPVALGEQIMQVADPARTQLEIQLPVTDAIELQSGAPVLLFLNTDPSAPLRASLKRLGYRASATAEGAMAYRLKGAFEAPDPRIRIGLKGTAKVYGERTSLFTYLLRRPLATLRIWLAL